LSITFGKNFVKQEKLKDKNQPNCEITGKSFFYQSTSVGWWFWLRKNHL